MSSSDNKQTNPGETLSFTKIVQTIDNLIEHHPILKSKPSLEHHPIFESKPSLEHHPIFKSKPSLETTTAATSGNSSPLVEIKSEGKGSSEGGKEDSKIDSELLKKIQNNLDQIKDSFIQLNKFGECELAKQLKTCLSDLDDSLKPEEKKTTGNANAPSFSEINRELMKLKYQIPSLRKMSRTSSRAQSQASSGSNVGGSVQVLPKLHKSEEFKVSSFYKEIEEIFDGLDENKNKFLSCFAVLTEHAVVKRTLLTYLGLGQGILSESDSTPEQIVDKILGEFKDKGLIEPATKKQKYEVRSYKMDPLVRSAVIRIYQEKKMFEFDSDGNVIENCAQATAFLVKGNKKPSEKSRTQEKLVTLFNLNDPSPDVKLNSLAKDVDWLSKMKKVEVLYLGRWQKSAGYHIEAKSTEFLKELTTMEELKFLSLQGISRINKLPSSIGMLKKLVVLDLKDCNNLEELPEEISKLKKLRYLDISHCYVIGNMPKKLSSLSQLQVLKGFVIGDPQSKILGTLEDLKGLKKLKKLTIIATRKDFPTPEDLDAFLELEALQKLTIAWSVQPKTAEYPEKGRESSKHGKATALSVLKLDKLEKLDLQCFPYSTPTWLRPGDLPKLEKLYIRGGNFTTLEKVKWKVKALRLKYLSGMKTNWRELKELFPDLAYLERVKCPGITLCPCDENGVWQNLKT
ncbi:uncharacterized protein LOC142628482 [Castanea sativa]|uniref:uncharacterized protein LOC142628482 n=1 Tax=Castanea sativa TaxID=21020 RepID=UPI003F64D2BA